MVAPPIVQEAEPIVAHLAPCSGKLGRGVALCICHRDVIRREQIGQEEAGPCDAHLGCSVQLAAKDSSHVRMVALPLNWRPVVGDRRTGGASCQRSQELGHVEREGEAVLGKASPHVKCNVAQHLLQALGISDDSVRASECLNALDNIVSAQHVAKLKGADHRLQLVRHGRFQPAQDEGSRIGVQVNVNVVEHETAVDTASNAHIGGNIHGSEQHLAPNLKRQMHPAGPKGRITAEPHGDVTRLVGQGAHESAQVSSIDADNHVAVRECDGRLDCRPASAAVGI